MALTKWEKQVIDEYVESWELQDELAERGYDDVYESIKDNFHTQVRLIHFLFSDLFNEFLTAVQQQVLKLFAFLKSMFIEDEKKE